MVNTRKGNCQARSSKAIDETSVSQTNMHGVRMRVHSHGSSSFDEIFIPMPGHPPATNPPVPDPDLVGESTKNLDGNFDDHANQNIADVDTHLEPTDTCACDNIEPDTVYKDGNMLYNGRLQMRTVQDDIECRAVLPSADQEVYCKLVL
ncbi:uncharacterized protein E6C27_scaffold335G00720 [Cucumis melo var. makuwa]|uniref:Uncharacterized protein n=1 Tax=Cucumis melo var. makuwa TaxID=1194695 RepID=A0A5A7TQ79_CUCMM|nr:uncharacterized protein E6C27_scaffold335G00720 [Cucumis melo var. makuwa]